MKTKRYDIFSVMHENVCSNGQGLVGSIELNDLLKKICFVVVVRSACGD